MDALMLIFSIGVLFYGLGRDSQLNAEVYRSETKKYTKKH